MKTKAEKTVQAEKRARYLVQFSLVPGPGVRMMTPVPWRGAATVKRLREYVDSMNESFTASKEDLGGLGVARALIVLNDPSKHIVLSYTPGFKTRGANDEAHDFVFHPTWVMGCDRCRARRSFLQSKGVYRD